MLDSSQRNDTSEIPHARFELLSTALNEYRITQETLSKRSYDTLVRITSLKY